MAPYVGEDEEDTQESTQEATQLASQDESQDELRRRSWGLLNPCSAHKHRAWLERASPVYKIGRSVHSNISLKGQKVSECRFVFPLGRPALRPHRQQSLRDQMGWKGQQRCRIHRYRLFVERDLRECMSPLAYSGSH
jgi:hypothetical protein